jgi:hypothetical protein
MPFFGGLLGGLWPFVYVALWIAAAIALSGLTLPAV